MPSPTTPFIIVAIDGGAASGKSSTSRALSQRFQFLHVDTGSPSEYAAIEETISPAALETITTWLLQHAQTTP